MCGTHRQTRRTVVYPCVRVCDSYIYPFEYEYTLVLVPNREYIRDNRVGHGGDFSKFTSCSSHPRFWKRKQKVKGNQEQEKEVLETLAGIKICPLQLTEQEASSKDSACKGNQGNVTPTSQRRFLQRQRSHRSVANGKGPARLILSTFGVFN